MSDDPVESPNKRLSFSSASLSSGVLPPTAPSPAVEEEKKMEPEVNHAAPRSRSRFAVRSNKVSKVRRSDKS